MLTILSSWYFANKSYYFGYREFLFPQHELIQELQRISKGDRIGYANELSRIRAATNVIYDLYTPEGLNPVFPYRYGQLIKSAVNGGNITSDIPRITVDVELRPRLDEPQEAFRIDRLINLLGIRYIAELKESGWYQDVYPRHTIAWNGRLYRIWENPDVLPRVFIAPQIEVFADPQSLLHRLYDPSVDLLKIGLVEEDVTVATGSTEGKEEVYLSSYRMNDLEVQVKNSAGGLLVLTDNYAPGWHALVDGKETPVYRTDFTFRGVVVPAGNHVVSMYYLPQAFVLGWWVMGGGIVLLVAAVFLFKRGT
jgi:hypothetical protein